MPDSLHILALGVTGPSGVPFCHDALARGYTLTIYGRNPQKLPASIIKHRKVNLVQGECNDEAQLELAASYGASVFASFLGPTTEQEGFPILIAYKLFMPLLLQHRYTRALILCTPAFEAPEDRESAFWDQVRAGIKSHIPLSFQEMKMIGNYVCSIPTDDLKWTMFRVPHLTDDERKPVHEAWVCDENHGVSLSRPSLSAWVLDEIEKGVWVGKAPMLSN